MKKIILLINCFLLVSIGFAQETPSKLNQAILLIEQRNFDEALLILNAEIKSEPQNRDYQYWKGYILLQNKDYSAAIGQFITTLKIDPEYHPAHAGLGYAYIETGKFLDAVNSYDKAIDFSNTNPEYFNNRGKAKYYLQKYQSAFFDFESAIKLDSNFALAYNNRGSSRYNNQNIAAATFTELFRALQDFNKCIELAPDFQIAYRNRGVVYYYLEKYNDSYKDLKLSTQMNPKDAVAFYQLARTLHKLGQYKLAEETYLQAIEMSGGGNVDIIQDRGLNYLEMSDYVSARGVFHAVSKLDVSRKAEMQYYIARTFARENNKNSMMEYLKKALKSGYFKQRDQVSALRNDKDFETYQTDKEYFDFLQKVLKLN